MTDRVSPLSGRLSIRDLALVLIAVGGDMTREADALVPQDEWDAIFAEGLATQVTGYPGGEPHSMLTPAGLAYVDRLLEPKEAVMQCRARRSHPFSCDYFIRCTQPEGHDGPHALDEPDSSDELTVWTDDSKWSLPPATDAVAHG